MEGIASHGGLNSNPGLHENERSWIANHPTATTSNAVPKILSNQNPTSSLEDTNRHDSMCAHFTGQQITMSSSEWRM